MADVLRSISTRRTPQTQRADRRQTRNRAGGLTFTIDGADRLRRFLILGTSGASYYQTAEQLTADNAETVINWAQVYPRQLVDLIVEISTAGRAPRQNPCIFALAAAASLGDVEGRRYALAQLATVCRTGTHLFLFAGYVKQFRGWGRLLRKAVGDWYLREPDQVAYQAVKYRQRGGWSHRDLLRLAHPKPHPDALSTRNLFDWITHPAGDYYETSEMPPIVRDFADAQEATGPKAAVEIIERGNGLSWEMLPTSLLNEPKVWEALIDRRLPTGALIRQLPRLTRLGLFKDRSVRARVLLDLADVEQLRRARIHPVNVLVAAKTYAAGQGKGGEWTPDRHIIDGLDQAFYKAFGAVEPAGKRTLIALDVSGSMSQSAGGLPISCAEAEAAIALVTLSTEPHVDVVGFTDDGWSSSRVRSRFWNARTGIKELPISPRQRLDDVLHTMNRQSMGGTDCALPMLWAKEQGRVYDTIVVMTDNETWAGSVHPQQTLAEYRQAAGVNTRLVVAGFTATESTIADPADPGSLDIVGLDSAVPQLISDFSRGDI